jgi:hypothetical protein
MRKRRPAEEERQHSPGRGDSKQPAGETNRVREYRECAERRKNYGGMKG